MNPSLRRIARRLFPGLAADRAIRYERAFRQSQGVPHIADAVFYRLGRAVVGGPFTGMRLVDGFETAAAAPVPKLLGVYEAQLHPALERAIAERPPVVANVGCAEGYYAVGIALRLPDAVVHAYDLARTARKMTLEAARSNGLGDRLQVHGRCRSFPRGTGLVVCDIEGAEDSLLDPAELRKATVIVETHEFARPGVTSRVRERFSPSHSVELLVSSAPESPLLDWLDPRERKLALEELRSGEQAWLAMWPRSE